MPAAKQNGPASFEAKIVLENHKGELKRLARFVEEFATAACLSRENGFALDLVLTEWITNVLDYGFEGKVAGSISVQVAADASHLRAQVEDDGHPFDPTQFPEVDISVPLERKPIGGLGIHLTRRFMDRVSYERREGRNCVVFEKSWQPSS
jgi:anti-sigma regulatory factor (Ser/Thr protein kinase)